VGLSAAAESEREAVGPLNVLVIDEEVPWPLDSGKRIRVWNLITRVAGIHHLTFLCYGRPDEVGVGELRRKGIRVETVAPLPELAGARLYWRLLLNLSSPYPYSVDKHYTARFRTRLLELLAGDRYDLLHCEWTPYARYLEPSLVKSLVATHNVESQIWKRRAECAGNPAARLFFADQARKMARFEAAAARRTSAMTAVSTLDVEQLRRWGAANCTLIENGVDLDLFRPADEAAERPELLFLGSLDWFPNRDALIYFLDEMFDEIRRRLPGVTLRIVGRRPPPELAQRLSSRDGVEMVGYVDDVRPHLMSAALVVVPLRVGGGSRIKILEALAAGKAVLSTSVGAEGIDIQDGENIAIADTPAAFSERAVRLLSDPEQRRRLGRNGRKLVEARYSWNTMASKLQAAWMQAAGAPRSQPAEAVASGSSRQ